MKSSYARQSVDFGWLAESCLCFIHRLATLATPPCCGVMVLEPAKAAIVCTGYVILLPVIASKSAVIGNLVIFKK